MSRGPNTSEPLWPVRYKPCEDELLSSWLTRLAHGMGLKVQTLCNLEFGSRRQVWNRDIDRLAPPWLLETLCRRTGTSREAAEQTTLRAYEGTFYRKYRASGTLPWMLALQMYHRRWTGYGLQFCPACLADGDACYYRRSWRVALHTVCLKHQCLLLDRCPTCQASLAFVRTELGRHEIDELPGLYCCHSCGCDLRQSCAPPPPCLDEEAASWLTALWMELGRPECKLTSVDNAEVLHVICTLLTRQRPALRLRGYLGDALGAEPALGGGGRVPIEIRPAVERHQLLQMAAWVMVDMPGRLRQALDAHALRYNHLVRDFRQLPGSYLRAVLTLRRRGVASR
ncbi:TniQ family protein [Roseateles sp.]|uniref:TniQ family protein n=1 Tax=Roseateles sp. TaxID=1971397 RepID=UPI0025FF8D36|nr:TniQ family protein [Roseateles sp.]MBV8035533.1 TniQ family protein [Roseateles sp.]